jgi:hypothetical protein
MNAVEKSVRIIHFRDTTLRENERFYFSRSAQASVVMSPNPSPTRFDYTAASVETAVTASCLLTINVASSLRVPAGFSTQNAPPPRPSKKLNIIPRFRMIAVTGSIVYRCFLLRPIEKCSSRARHKLLDFAVDERLRNKPRLLQQLPLKRLRRGVELETNLEALHLHAAAVSRQSNTGALLYLRRYSGELLL